MTSTHLGAPFRPDRPILFGLAWRGVLVVAACVAVTLQSPPWLRGTLSAAAAVAVALWFVQRVRRRDPLGVWLIVAGTLIVVLALLGVVLNLLPTGLSAAAWAVGVALVQLVVLFVLAFLRPPVGRVMGPHLRVSTLAWSAGAVGVLIIAVVWSALSFAATHESPLAMSARRTGSSFSVTVSSEAASGPFRIDLVTDAGRSVLARDVRVGPDRDASITVRLPEDGRGLVQLVPAGEAGAVRELILERTPRS